MSQGKRAVAIERSSDTFLGLVTDQTGRPCRVIAVICTPGEPKNGDLVVAERPVGPAKRMRFLAKLLGRDLIPLSEGMRPYSIDAVLVVGVVSRVRKEPATAPVLQAS